MFLVQSMPMESKGTVLRYVHTHTSYSMGFFIIMLAFSVLRRDHHPSSRYGMMASVTLSERESVCPRIAGTRVEECSHDMIRV